MDWAVIEAATDAFGARRGAAGGPAALRVAGLQARLGEPPRGARGEAGAEGGRGAGPARGARVRTFVAAPPPGGTRGGTIGMGRWVAAVAAAAADAAAWSPRAGRLCVGGDHSIAAGSLAVSAWAAVAEGRPLFVLWIDAHADFHTPATSVTGNLHGTPLAYAAGLPGFAPDLPPMPSLPPGSRLAVLGARDVDEGEWPALRRRGVAVHAPEPSRPGAMVEAAGAFAAAARAAGARLHVSFDVDALDPTVAPATGTPVPGGLGVAEAFAVVAALREGGPIEAVDLVEYDPSLDRNGATAALAVALAVALCGGVARRGVAGGEPARTDRARERIAG